MVTLYAIFDRCSTYKWKEIHIGSGRCRKVEAGPSSPSSWYCTIFAPYHLSVGTSQPARFAKHCDSCENVPVVLLMQRRVVLLKYPRHADTIGIRIRAYSCTVATIVVVRYPVPPGLSTLNLVCGTCSTSRAASRCKRYSHSVDAVIGIAGSSCL